MSLLDRKRFLAVALATLLTCHVPQARAETATVTVAMLAPSTLQWLHAVAEAEGFYAKHGVAVRELRASDSSSLVQAVASGSANAGIALGDLAVRAIDRGAPIVMAGALLDRTILRLYGAPGVTSPKDLAGKAVTAGAVKGGTANLLRFLLKQDGVAPDSVRMVSIANSRDRIVAMSNGQVAGSLLIPPFDTLAEQNGATLLDTYRQAYTQTPLIFDKGWAKANPTAARGLAQALKQAAGWIDDKANKGRAIEILAQYTKTDAALCARAYGFIVEAQKAIPADLAVSPDGIRNLFAIDDAVGGGDGTPGEAKLATYFDPSFLN